jgi:superfamily I DNA/RNA helicase
MPWNDGLDPRSPAHAIAADTSRVIRVVAGPGTGKSFALKRRVARLLETGATPRGILPVTFTNVAAEDLQRELRQVGVAGCEEIKGSTLHGLGLRILSRRGVLQATGRHPRPLNAFEMEPLLYDLTARFGRKGERKKRIKAYEAAWARLQHEEPGYAPSDDDRAFEQALVGWLRFHQGMLIGEIVPQLHQYLRNNPAAEERRLYTHILVDEYQDLNKAEQSLIDLLSGGAEICIVGDDDQSLYSFKHAHPDGIRRFHDTHPGTNDHQVLECRRCPTRVVEIANALIAYNTDRVGRQLTPLAGNGPGDVRIIQYPTLAAEAHGIAEMVRILIERQGRRPEDILILAQRRVIGDPIHNALLARGIPSKSYYLEGDLQRVEAQDRLALLKLLVNQDDRIALRWLLGYGHPNFRASAYARVRARCETTGETPWNVLAQLEAGSLTLPYTQTLVIRFREIRAALAPLQAAPDLVAFRDAWLPAADPSLSELRTLVATLKPETEDVKGLHDALIAAVSTPEIPPNVTQVRIMSLHKSKGLSSPVVIIAGCVEGLLPARPDADLPAAEQQAQMEEQRRLFYVGLTRVKAEPTTNRQGTLILTSSVRMSVADAMGAGIEFATSNFGNANLLASRFLSELGPAAPAPQAG